MIIVSSWNLIFFMFFSFSLLFFFSSLVFLVKSYGIYLTWMVFSWSSSNVVFILLLDWISLMFLSFVLFISGSVFYYSGEYMLGELELPRFIVLLTGFVMSMALLILSPNLISILLGWDGLGLVSYCLVVYYQNSKSLNAGILTVLSNRVGDVLILLGIVYMINYGDWNLIAWLGSSNSLILVSSLVILATLTKSAQIPFSAWLPAAMAAPTPVSSLVHSSTLVTAGIYLVIRLGWIYDFWLNELLSIISALTMFMAGLGACFELDLKKIIALSTLSQLGLMMYSLSLGLIKLALFHLLMHALFKALLFMSTGCIIHNYKNWQDLRSMGSVMLSLPYTSSCFVISNLALSGMPFLAGFYSKDLILEISLMQEVNFLNLIILFISTGLTVIYTFRLIYYVVYRESVLGGSFNISDGNGPMMKSCLGLTFFSLFFGASMSWLMMDIMSINLPYFLKTLTLLVCFSGGMLGASMAVSSHLLVYKKNLLLWFSGMMWFLPYLSSQPFLKSPLTSGGNFMNLSDMGWLELMGGQGIWKGFNYISMNLQLLNYKNLKVFLGIILLFYLIFL
uniref:NADH dehydrogenase subunit 5 n=1 Tax=Regioscalpellum regium TaxID=2977353 RepID=UPI0021CD0472|nr:NADH dehydrogenase subunit 5 [Regioscalpellum regium]UWM13003.1 NADH dehydrogenase subunit 5 [Regioscalpellum regium]